MIPTHLALGEAIAGLAGNRTYAGLVARDDLEIGLYMPIGTDRQTPHDRDEVYIVTAGSGSFACGEETIDFAAGDLLHVPAHVSHRFERFDVGFTAWVIFHGPVRPQPI